MAKRIDHSARAHALLSASSAHRWLVCPSSAFAAAAYPAADTVFTIEGTKAHEIAEAVARTGEAPEGADPEMVRHAEEYAEYIHSLEAPGATVLLEQRVDFSDWVPGGFGTCDCMILHDGVLKIVDYKYGAGERVSAERNPQMMLYALGALHDYGIAYDCGMIEMHIFQPRIDNVSIDAIPAHDLLAWAEDKVKPIAEQAVKGKGGYTAGPHCRFCPHAGRCRKLATVAKETVRAHGMTRRVEVLMPDEIADILTMEPMISLWLRRVKAQAQADLLAGKEIPGYKVVAGKLGNRKWSGTEEDTAAALRAAGVDDGVIFETKLASPTAVEKAIGKKQAAVVLDGLVTRDPGAPSLVPASDKREAINAVDLARRDFA